MAVLTLKGEALKDFPPLVRDFATYKSVIMGISEKTVCEYLLDLRTFFRYTEAMRLGAEMSPSVQKPTEAATASTATVYTVQKGDTLSKIAFEYGVTVDDIAKYNGISNPNLIHVGQKIKIPAALKPLSEIAKEVIQGKWGNGAERKKRLTAAGYDYDDVQARVAVLLK